MHYSNFLKTSYGRLRLYIARIKLPKMPKMWLTRDSLPPQLARPLYASKIGIVYDDDLLGVEKRLSALNTGNPFDVEMPVCVPCDEPRVFEKYWHEEYVNKKVKGEWFDLSDDDINCIADTTLIHHMTGDFAGDNDRLERIRLETERAGTKETRSPKKVSMVLSKSLVKEILQKYKTKLQRGRIDSKRAYLNKTEFKIVLQALHFHPDAEDKIGKGVYKIFVALTSFQNCCFHVKRVDGSEEDFSYRYCFGALPNQIRHYTYKVPGRDEGPDGLS
jgi:hypothetical protein